MKTSDVGAGTGGGLQGRVRAALEADMTVPPTDDQVRALAGISREPRRDVMERRMSRIEADLDSIEKGSRVAAGLALSGSGHGFSLSDISTSLGGIRIESGPEGAGFIGIQATALEKPPAYDEGFVPSFDPAGCRVGSWPRAAIPMDAGTAVGSLEVVASAMRLAALSSYAAALDDDEHQAVSRDGSRAMLLTIRDMHGLKPAGEVAVWLDGRYAVRDAMADAEARLAATLTASGTISADAAFGEAPRPEFPTGAGSTPLTMSHISQIMGSRPLEYALCATGRMEEARAAWGSWDKLEESLLEARATESGAAAALLDLGRLRYELGEYRFGHTDPAEARPAATGGLAELAEQKGMEAGSAARRDTAAREDIDRS